MVTTISAPANLRRPRLLAALGVAGLHVAMGLALVSGLGVTIAQTMSENIRAFDVSEVPPPPVPEPEKVTEPARAAPQPESEAAPTNVRATPVPVVVPPPVVPVIASPPIVAAPVPAEGLQPEAGAGDADGPGTGAGGEGTGNGSGTTGNGSGGGGVAVHAERIKGQIRPSDYPKAAYRAHASGTVFVRITVGPDGRVSACAIDESSGRADLDERTCQIILERYRYRPARDAAGNPVPEVVHMAQVWETGRRR